MPCRIRRGRSSLRVARSGVNARAPRCSTSSNEKTEPGRQSPVAGTPGGGAGAFPREAGGRPGRRVRAAQARRRDAGRTRKRAHQRGCRHRRHGTSAGRSVRAMESRRRRRRPEGAAESGARRPSRPARTTARHRVGTAVRDHAGRGERRRKDHLDRQARPAVPGAGALGAARRGRHVSRGSARTARRLGRAQRRHRDFAARRRSGRRDVRRDRGRDARGGSTSFWPIPPDASPRNSS